MEVDKNKVDVLMATPPPSERENSMSDNNEVVAQTEANNDNNNNNNENSDNTYDDFHKLLNELGLLNYGKTCNALYEPNKIYTESASGEFRRRVKRVVLFGNAFSGKRTLCNHLRLAAMRAETRARELIRNAMLNNSNTNNEEKVNSQVKNKTVLALTDQQLRSSLYNPYADNANVTNSTNQSAIDDENISNQCAKRQEMECTKNDSNCDNNSDKNEKEEIGKREALCSLVRGIGLTQCYIRNYHFSPLRELERLSSEQKMYNEQNNEDKYNNEIDVKSVVTCDLEFFCCDHAAGLHTAIPDTDCLEDLLLLIVIDVSQVESIISTIRTLYKQIEEHVITLLRAKYANEYVTHLCKLKEQVQKLRVSCFSCNVAPESNNIDSTTHESVEKETESVVCPIHSMLVCTHIDRWNDIELNNYKSFEYEEEENLYQQREECQNSKELMATITHKIENLPDAVRSIIERKGIGVAEMIKETVCAEGTKHALAVLGVSSHLVNNYYTTQESKNNVLDLFLTQMWNAIHCLLSITVNTNTMGIAKSNVIRCLQSLKKAWFEQNAWLVFADDSVHATSSNVNDSKINSLSEEERHVMMEYLLGNLHHIPITSINGNSSLNIITHRELINTLEALRTKSKDKNDDYDNISKNTEIKIEEKNEREFSYGKEIDDNSNQRPHSHLPTTSINSTCSIEGNPTNTNADDADEQFVWDTV